MTNATLLTAEHFEPWNGNIVDLTMRDGSHAIGLLHRVDAQWVRLTPYDGVPLTGSGFVRIADTAAIARGARN
jgi:hypothetical protein